MKEKLILGTVQFGLNYGINNLIGKPSEKEVFEILDEAAQQGITSLDTANAYGNAMELIGKYHRSRNIKFNVLSKFKNVSKGNLKDDINRGLDDLNIESFDVYSYHSFSDFYDNQYLSEELQKAKQTGRIKRIGVSVYTNEELEKVVSSDTIDVIQLPYNLLDNENIRGELLSVAKSKHKEIHTRSVFLQGLFFKNTQTIPEKLAGLSPYIDQVTEVCNRESISIESLALSYVLFNKNIDNVLIGVDTKEQLLANINSIVAKSEIFEYIDRTIKVKEVELLNPVNWV